MKRRLTGSGYRLGLTAVLALSMGACEGMKLGGSRGGEAAEVPVDAALKFKLAALEYGMDNLAPEDRSYIGEEEYAAYGLMDPNPDHERILVAALAGRRPPVVAASQLYSRASNSQWIDGEPAMKWTASAEFEAATPDRASVLVGWMHSQLIHEFTDYTLERRDGDWFVIDVALYEE